MKKLILVGILLLFSSKAYGLANFPEAEGYGSETVAGRYGGSPTIYIVSNTNDSGSGSLREAVESSGPRIVVFSTGGTIALSSTLTVDNPYITIAGQTAPGGGITIRNRGIVIQTHDVVLRFLTVRVGTGGGDGIALYENNPIDEVYNVVVDHCTVSWATDENLTSWYDTHDVTWSWNISSEGLNYSDHSMGVMAGGYADGTDDNENPSENFSIHHNLMAHNDDRNGPYLRGGGYIDVVNNVAYNSGGNNFAYAAQEAGVLLRVNLRKNYFKDGPDTGSSSYVWRTYEQSGALGVETFVEGNYHSRTRTSDSQGEDVCVYPADRVVEDANTTGSPNAHLIASAWSDPPTVTEYDAFGTLFSEITADAGNSRMVNCSGNWELRRDSIDERIVTETTNGTGGIIDYESDVGGWISIDSGSACTDSDSDGMPDTFEMIAFGDLSQTATGDYDSDGYLNIEEYFNGIAINWYFNNSTGNDTTGTGTYANPWKTLSKFRTEYNALSSGDVNAYFNRGDEFTFYNSGFDYIYVDAGRLHLRAYGSGNNPVFVGLDDNDPQAELDFSLENPLDHPATRNRWDPIIRFADNSEGSSVSNIDFRSHHGAAISNSGEHSNITISHCNFSNLGMHAVSLGPDNSIIEYSTADLCQRLEEYGYHSGMWGAAFSFRGSGGNNIIRYSRVTRTYGEGIYLESGGTAEKCVVGPTYSVGIYVVPHATTATSGYVIKHNTVYGYKNTTIPGTVENYRGNDNGIGICDESAGGSNSVTVDIIGNFVIHRRWGMRIYDLDGSAIWGTVSIHNNTVIDSYLNNYEFESAARFSTVYFYNNASIYYDIASTFLDEGHVYDNIGENSDYIRTYNLYYPVNGTYPVDAYWADNDVTSDPALTATSGWTEPPPAGIVPWDTSLFDFQNLVPGSGSALIDTGTTILDEYTNLLTAITDITGDLDANSFILGDTSADNLPEIGALTENVGSSASVYAMDLKFEINASALRVEANAPAMLAQVLVEEQQQQSCNTSQFGETGTTTGNLGVARFETSSYRGAQFVYTGTTTTQICAASLWLNFTGSTSHTYYVAIYSNSGGSPGSLLGTSDGQDLSSIGGSETEISFDFSTPTSALTNGSTYWIVLYSASFDSSNYASWYYEADGATERSTFSGDGSAWTSADGTTTYKFEIFSLGD